VRRTGIASIDNLTLVEYEALWDELVEARDEAKRAIKQRQELKRLIRVSSAFSGHTLFPDGSVQPRRHKRTGRPLKKTEYVRDYAAARQWVEDQMGVPLDEALPDEIEQGLLALTEWRERARQQFLDAAVRWIEQRDDNVRGDDGHTARERAWYATRSYAYRAGKVALTCLDRAIEGEPIPPDGCTGVTLEGVERLQREAPEGFYPDNRERTYPSDTELAKRYRVGFSPSTRIARYLQHLYEPRRVAYVAEHVDDARYCARCCGPFRSDEAAALARVPLLRMRDMADGTPAGYPTTQTYQGNVCVPKRF